MYAGMNSCVHVCSVYVGGLCMCAYKHSVDPPMYVYRVYVCIFIYAFNVCMYVCLCVRACVHACMHACMYVCMYVYMYVCMYVICMF